MHPDLWIPCTSLLELFNVQPDLWIPCTSFLEIWESSCTLLWVQIAPDRRREPRHSQGDRALINPECHEPSSTCSGGAFLEHHRISPTRKLHYRAGHRLPFPSPSWLFSSCGCYATETKCSSRQPGSVSARSLFQLSSCPQPSRGSPCGLWRSERTGARRETESREQTLLSKRPAGTPRSSGSSSQPRAVSVTLSSGSGAAARR